MFGQGGLLSSALPNFEVRLQQEAMAKQVEEAIIKEKIALIEAGTGTGKTLAYGAPAILAALSKGKRVVISTHTINLQQQLVDKDLPFLLKTLRADLKVVLVKGMYNYLCIRKMGDSLIEKGAYTLEEAEEVEEIEGWSKKTDDGSRSGLSFVPTPATWERLGAELDACGGKRCPFYKECFFVKARKEVEDAQILVVNHHLLLADLALKAESDEASILPDYDLLIIDEAHHLEDIATDAWAARLTRFEWIKLLGRAFQEKGGARRGKLPLLERQIGASALTPELIRPLLDKLSWELPAEKKRLVGDINDLFHLLCQFLEENHAKGEKMRLLPDHLTHPFWTGQVVPAVEGVLSRMGAYVQSLRALDSEVALLQDKTLMEKTESIRLDIKAIAGRIEACCKVLSRAIFDEIAPSEVRWIESFTSNGFVQAALISASLDPSPLLADRIFRKVPSVVLTSATLTTNKTFSFIRKRLGLTDALLDGREVVEAIYDSPFSYETQSLLVIPSDMPSPLSPQFIESASCSILKALQASQGGAFVLFTSFSMLRKCHSLLKNQLEEAGYPVLKQGEKERSLLLETFRSKENSILFGTDSFWEGVDVIGKALRLVILAKLPFQVPTEPIIQARLAALMEEGKDPFMEYSVPQAIVKFKQGLGRLIRHHTDRGCILCLDGRLKTKGYGKAFLESIPPCAVTYGESVQVEAVLKKFYGA